MSNQAARSLYELIGAPLMALVDAESQAAKATANFIREIGFKEDSPESKTIEDLGDLRMVTFRSQKNEADGTRRFKIEVPLLSLLPIPALQIKDAELEFFAKIVEYPKITQPPIEPKKNTGSGSVPTEDEKAQKYGLRQMPGRDLKATFGTASAGDPVSRQGRLDMLIKIKIRMEQADIPAGLSSLFNLMQQHITSQPITDKEK